MKTMHVVPSVGAVLVLAAGFFIGSNFALQAQIRSRGFPTNSAGFNPFFDGFPGALPLVSNILSAPVPVASVMVAAPTNSSRLTAGTYWTLQRAPAPFPVNPFPEAPVYLLDATNHIWIIDDRGINYNILDQLWAEQARMQALTNGTSAANSPGASELENSGALWLEIPADGLAVSNQLAVIVHNTSQGQPYTMLTKRSLLESAWAFEESLTGAAGDFTTTQLLRNGRTNLFVWARTGNDLNILPQPLSQDVLEGDTVTFSVVASGEGTLNYQWTCENTNIPGATASSHTINNVKVSDAADYAVIVSNGSTSLASQTAHLTVEGGWSDPFYMELFGQRQDYSFKNGVTYYIGSAVELYGTTTLRGGNVIKFDWYTNSSLVVKGALVCDTQPYYPAILTSVDDDSVGQVLFWISTGDPQPATNGAAYLNLDAATGASVKNLFIRYADQGMTTPVASRRLDVWDCQFLHCNFAIANQVAGEGALDSLHNVLFAHCGAVVGAASNSVALEAEQVTADVQALLLASVPPSKIALTNSIIGGTFSSSSGVFTQNVVFNPSVTNFQIVNADNYYLAANSALHHAGTTNISPGLLAELKHKTTQPPISLPAGMHVTGELTLYPQAARYTNGPPDLGYHYTALDYTAAQDLNTGFNNPFVGSGSPAENLMQASLRALNTNAATVTLHGLLPGSYDLYLYSSAGNGADQASVTAFTINGVTVSVGPNNSTTALLEGTNYVHIAPTVSGNGLLNIRFIGTAEGGLSLLNGFQLSGPGAIPSIVILDLQKNGAQLTLTWPAGTLLEATNLLGPWTTNAATSPFTFPPSLSTPQKFYRVRVQ